MVHGTSDLADRATAMAAEAGFLGVPLEGFAATGKKQLDALLTPGLNSDSKLLDIGCGCLRGGYWLIRFLAPGRYCGIEPHWKRVELGLRHLLEPDVLAEKRPRFDRNDAFDWSHASKPQIERTLDGFLRDTTEEGVFMTSYVPATRPEDDYGGREWVGTSHTCDVRVDCPDVRPTRARSRPARGLRAGRPAVARGQAHRRALRLSSPQARCDSAAAAGDAPGPADACGGFRAS